MSEAPDSPDIADAQVCDFFLGQNLADLERRIETGAAPDDPHRLFNLYLLALAQGDTAKITRLAGEISRALTIGIWSSRRLCWITADSAKL